MGVVQVVPPSVDRMNKMLEPEVGSPKNELVEFDHAKFSTPFCAAKSASVTRRLAWTNVRRPKRPASGAPSCMDRRNPPLFPQSINSPACTIGTTEGSEAPGILKLTKEKLLPPSSERRMRRKSVSLLLNCANEM